MKFLTNIKKKYDKYEKASLKKVQAKTKKLKKKNEIINAYEKQRSIQSKVKKAKVKRVKSALGLNKKKRKETISSSPFAPEKW